MNNSTGFEFGIVRELFPDGSTGNWEIELWCLSSGLRVEDGTGRNADPDAQLLYERARDEGHAFNRARSEWQPINP
ncbi:hypothetical protein AB6B38_10495 [Glycocaulis abyssi]|uniref:Uncharacterized protein n=1 Tax=Glycocaulis abyssi TaxID=1433403 RepID=A0ABV9NDT4_9PROT